MDQTVDTHSQSENHSATYDVENPKRAAYSLDSPSFLEAAAFLTVFSLFLINQGSIQVMRLYPTENLLDGGAPSKFLLFLGHLFEFFYGLLGLGLGLTALVFRGHNATVTKLCMFIQIVLSIYTFMLVAFIAPGFAVRDITEPQLIGLTTGESKFIRALGLLTSVHFFFALQGGQFVFMARLVSESTGTDFMWQKSGYKLRAIFWNLNLAIPGFWTLVTGAMVNEKVGGGRLQQLIFSPPTVGHLPGLTIFTGLGVCVLGLLGVVMAVLDITPPALYFLLAAVVYVDGLLNFGIVQFGLIGAKDLELAGIVAMLNGLVFVGVFIGPYFLHLQSKDKMEKEA